MTLARSNLFFDPQEHKGYNSAFDYHWSSQIPAGFYAHGCYEEAHRQLFKLFKRVGENAGLGPRFRGEVYDAVTGEIHSCRNVNYPACLNVLTNIVEGVFGLRWTADALTVEVHAPWPWAKLRNLRIRKAKLELELSADGTLSALVDGEEVMKSSDGKLQLPWRLFE